MALPQLPIAYITAGAGGMYCGSCMHDNALASELIRQGVDIQLIPTYTPIRTDDPNVSISRVFYGGINVYLQQRLGLFRYLPRFMDQVLDHPRLIRWAARRQLKIRPAALAELTHSMLRGEAGFQRKEVQRLIDWLARTARPSLVNFSNLLIAGCAPELKRRLQVPIVVTLQGDDVFLEQLPAASRDKAKELIRRFLPSIDAYLVHSQFYADFMANYLGLPRERMQIVRLGVDTDAFGQTVQPPNSASSSAVIAYLARVAPEKGLHHLCEAFVQLRDQPDMAHVRLRIAGWSGPDQLEYLQQSLAPIRSAGLAADCEYVGELTRAEKIRFLHQSDLVAVPTVYREPKGLYVLEALAAGRPVVVPDHGAFPELIRATGGGKLVPPHQPAALADQLAQLLREPDELARLATQGQQAVRQNYSLSAMAQSHIAAYQRVWSAFSGGGPTGRG